VNTTSRKRSPARAPAVERSWVVPALVATVTVAAFLPVLSAGFVNFDDDRVLVRNPYLRLAWPERLRWMWSTFHMGHYQPLTWLSLSIDRALGDWNPAIFHADSLLLHAGAAVVLYALIRELLGIATGQPETTRIRVCAASGALFWAIHPLRVESVAWIAERRDPLSTLFYFLAVLTYVRSVRVGRPQLKSFRLYVLALAWFVLSILSKAWAMSLFVILTILDWYPLGRLPLHPRQWLAPRNKTIWLEKLPFAAIGLTCAVVAWAAQRSSPDTMVTLSRWPLKDRLLQAMYGLCFYPGKTIWPTRLAVLYELPSTIAGLPALYLICIVIVASVAVLAAARMTSSPWLFAVLVCYAVIVAPVLGVAQSGPQFVADRYAYLSCAPFSVLIAAGLLRLRGPAARVIAAAAAIAVAVLAGLTWRQSTFWHDSTTLWAHALDAGRPSYVAHLDYGQALRADGRIDAAIAQYREALALRPDSGNAWYNLANALKAKGDLEGAEAAYRNAIAYLSWKVEAHLNLGNLYYTRRQLGPAIDQYRAATAALDGAAAPDFTPEPYLYLGMALADSGDRDGARRALAVARRYSSTHDRAEAELKRLGG